MRREGTGRGWLWIVISIAGLVSFLYFFDHHVPQATDLLWFVALFGWTMFVRSLPESIPSQVLLRRVDYRPLLLFVPVFAVTWMQSYDDWRWAFTGDSFGVFSVGYWFGKDGLSNSPLSVHGIDDTYTRLWEISYNWLMRLIEPTLFWHRVGQLLMVTLALIATYTFYALLLGPWWALLIILASATNYVFLWMSYISYLHTDSYLFYYLTLIAALMLWRTPERLGGWMLAGLLGGLSLLYTPVVWGAVGAIAIVFGLIDMRHGRWKGIAVYTVSFLLAGLPMLIELPWMLNMLSEQAIGRYSNNELYIPEPMYWVRTFVAIMVSGFDTPIRVLGVNGAILRFPLTYLYLIGMLMAAIGAIPAVRRRLRIPAAAPALLALMIFDALLFTFTNKGYGAPSHKRYYNLIPLQIFLALLPLYVIACWNEHRVRARWMVRLLALAVVAVAAWGSVDQIVHPVPGMYGSNFYDGLIELRQRFPERDVLLVSARNGIGEMTARDTLMNQTYGVVERLTLVPRLEADERAQQCRAGLVVCYDMRGTPEAVANEMAEEPDWRRFPLLNSTEIRCYECDQQPTPR